MPYLSDQELGELCLSLATLLHSGMGLSYGAGLLPAASGGKKKAVEAIKAGAVAGLALSASLPDNVCPPYMIGLVRMGEESGKLEQALYALSDYYYERDARTRRIKSALTYPIILSVLMIAVIGVLLVRILPVFDRVYRSLGGGMTGMAGALLRAGIVLDAILPFACAIAAILLIAALAIVLVPSARTAAIAWYNAKYGDKGISRKINDARFAQALSMGLSSGMPLDEAVELAAGLNDSVPAAKARYAECVSMIRTGSTVTEALEKTGSLPPDACALLSLGQAGGSLDELMDGIARRMSDDADQAIDSISARVEPALVIAASAATGAILISVMLPLMDIMAAMG